MSSESLTSEGGEDDDEISEEVSLCLSDRSHMSD
jgi:hypothetical protein